MRTFRRSARFIAPLAFLLPIAACSSGSGEKPNSAASALDPSNVIPPTTYTVSMWAEVHNALEPTAWPDTFYGKPHFENCWGATYACDPDCNNYSCWTPDTGYQFYGILGAEVDDPSGNVISRGSQPCLFNTPKSFGVTGPSPEDGTYPDRANITTCTDNPPANAGPNGPWVGGAALSQLVQVLDPRDKVTLALVLDNVEANAPAAIPSSSIGAQLTAGAGTVGKVGTVLSWIPTPATAGAGAAFGAMSQAISIVGLLEGPGQPSTPGTKESCVGGVFPDGNGGAVDTAFLQITGQQLDVLAEQGGDLSTRISGSWESGYCTTDITLHVTATRSWSGGLAAAPRSADFAMVSAPNQMDLMVVPQTKPAGADTANQFVRVSGDNWTWSAPATTDGYPFETAAGEGVTPSTYGSLVQLAKKPANGIDEFLFWADNNSGTIRVQGYDHTNLKAPGYLPGVQAFYRQEPGFCWGRFCSPPINIVPNNAHVVGISLLPTYLDAFFVGADGNVWEAWSPDNGTTWNQLQVTTDAAGIPGSPLAVVARTPGDVDVFFLGKNGLEDSKWHAGGSFQTSVVAGTAGLAAAGSPVTAVAQNVNDLDVFFLDKSGNLWRAWASYAASAQPTLLAYQVNAGSAPDGYANGPIAAVSRAPGVLDVVYRGAGSSPIWTELNTNSGSRTKAALSSLSTTVSNVSIVAPSSYEVRAFILDSLSDVYTGDYAATGVAQWTALTPVEDLTPPPQVTICTTCPPVHVP